MGMKTEVIKVERGCDGSEAVRRAADVLLRGGLVAFPTETVYGLGAAVVNREAVERLRDVKSRKAEQAFTVHIATPSDASRFGPVIEGLAARFIRKAWPGPLTLILPVEDPSAAPVMANLNGSAASTMYRDNTIGLRCPDDPIAEALLRTVEVPVVAASANAAGRPAPQTGAEVLKDLDGRFDLLIDTGDTRYAKPSTIVRVTGASYKLVREGVLDSGIVKRLSKLSILLVCTGNTCRSPMAAAFAKRMLADGLGCGVDDLPGRGVEVFSAGTAGGGGGGASPHAISVMAKRGIDLSNHVSVALTAEMVRQADDIFAMTKAHRDTIISLVPSAKDRVKLLLDEEDIQDPMGGSEEVYERCARTIEEGLAARMQEVIV